MLNIGVIINEFGTDVTIGSRTSGSYDPITDIYTGTTATATTKAQIEVYKNDVNELIKAGTYKAFCLPTVAIKEKDKLTWNSVEYTVLQSFPYMTNGQVEYYEVAFAL